MEGSSSGSTNAGRSMEAGREEIEEARRKTSAWGRERDGVGAGAALAALVSDSKVLLRGVGRARAANPAEGGELLGGVGIGRRAGGCAALG
jgi:hypothetical protein